MQSVEMQPMAVVPQNSGAMAVVQREDTEIKAALILARQFPRDEYTAALKFMKSLERSTFADKAVYKFQRGGKNISGPSVAMAREFQRCWGNIRSGVRIVEETEDETHIRGFSLDMETNAYFELEDKFRKLIQRKVKDGGTEWRKPDERDLRELIFRRGAILERNCILKLAPADVIEDALAKAKETAVKAANGELKESPQETKKKLVKVFDELGVTVAMLEDRLGHGIDQVNAEELADLRQIYRSIVDGNSKRDEFFDFGLSPQSQQAKDLGESIKKTAKPKTQAPKQEEPAASEPVAVGPIPQKDTGSFGLIYGGWSVEKRALYDREFNQRAENGEDLLDAHDFAYMVVVQS